MAKKILRLSYDEWKNTFQNKVTVSCAVTFEDGWRGTFCFVRYQHVVNEIDMLSRTHGQVSYISCTK